MTETVDYFDRITERNKAIYEKRCDGILLRILAATHGVTIERIRQILRRETDVRAPMRRLLYVDDNYAHCGPIDFGDEYGVEFTMTAEELAKELENQKFLVQLTISPVDALQQAQTIWLDRRIPRRQI